MNEINYFFQNNYHSNHNNSFSFKIDFWAALLIIAALAIYFYNKNKKETKSESNH